MNPSTELPFLLRMVEEEVRLLAGFLDLLQEEERLLLDGAADQLVELADRKTQLYHQLQRIHDDRALRLARLGLGNDDAGMRKVLEAGPAALPRWEAVLDLATQARDRNTSNGKLIAERMRHNQGALSILMAATERPQFYGRDGQTRFGGRGRNFGSA